MTTTKHTPEIGTLVQTLRDFRLYPLNKFWVPKFSRMVPCGSAILYLGIEEGAIIRERPTAWRFKFLHEDRVGFTTWNTWYTWHPETWFVTFATKDFK